MIKKNKICIFPLIILGLLLILTSNCKKEEENKLPILTTSETTTITSTTAIGGGSITSDGGTAIIERGVCYGSTTNPNTSNSKVTTTGTIGQFTCSLVGLTPASKYYVRAYATNSIGTAYGNEISFSTTLGIPNLITMDATLVTTTTSTCGGSIANDGGTAITERGVCYGTTQSPSIENSKITTTGTIGLFTCSLVGLTPATTYYARAYATNAIGTAYGNEITFKTAGLEVGQQHEGGIIAYIFQSSDLGYVANEIHGLIAATTDQSYGIKWYNDVYISTGATATAIGTGKTNTNLIVINQGTGSYAAKLCYDLELNGYSDWYLPSIEELNKLYENRVAIGGFDVFYYWSSSEKSIYTAMMLTFAYGSQASPDKSDLRRVRAVRTF